MTGATLSYMEKAGTQKGKGVMCGYVMEIEGWTFFELMMRKCIIYLIQALSTFCYRCYGWYSVFSFIGLSI